jgi:hypothetical protein
MNPPSTDRTARLLWKRLARILAYYILLFAIMLALLTRYLPSFMPFVLVPLLWFCTRPTFPLNPRLPEQDFSFLERWLWFGGAGVCALIALGCAYGTGVRGTLDLFRAVAIGVGSWAFAFLVCRDCRRSIHHA